MVSFESFSLDQPLHDLEKIREVNPHRHEMELIDSVLYLNEEESQIVGLKRVREDEFWCRGHFPDGAIFPGVLMLEAAAQLSSFFCGHALYPDSRMLFGSANEVRFRGMVKPGDDLVLMGTVTGARRRGTRCRSQGFVDQKLVFEAEIVGMLV